MPYDLLRKRRVIIEMDEVLAYSDTGPAAENSRLKNLKTLTIRSRFNIERTTFRVSTVTGTSLRKVVGTGAKGARNLEWYSSKFARLVKFSERRPVEQ